MRARLFWKLGLTYLALLLGVLFAVDLYSARVFRRDSIRSADDKLASLLGIALARPPRSTDPSELRTWTELMARSGVRVTVIDKTGRVLADSQPMPETTQNQSDRLEVQEAFATAQGSPCVAARRSIASSCIARALSTARRSPGRHPHGLAARRN